MGADSTDTPQSADSPLSVTDTSIGRPDLGPVRDEGTPASDAAALKPEGRAAADSPESAELSEIPRPIVIGEQQDRVVYAAERFGAETYPGLPAKEAGLPEGSADLKAAQLEHNEAWIGQMRDEGRLVIDTGPAEPRGQYPEPTRPSDWPAAPYEVELSAIEDYPNVIRPWEDMTGTPNFPWKYDSSTYQEGEGYYRPEQDTAADEGAAPVSAVLETPPGQGDGTADTLAAEATSQDTAPAADQFAARRDASPDEPDGPPIPKPPTTEVVNGSTSGDVPAADCSDPVNEPITLDGSMDRASQPYDSASELVLVANTPDDLPPEIRERLNDDAITGMGWPVEVYDRVMSDGESFEKFSHFDWNDAHSTAERQPRAVPHDPGRSMAWMRPVGEGKEEVFFDVVQDLRQTPRGQQLTDAEVGKLGKDFAPSDPHENLAISREFDGALSREEARNARYTLTFEPGAHVRYIKSTVAPQDSPAERRTGPAELAGGGSQSYLLDYDTDRSTLTVAPVGGRVQFPADGSMRWGYRDRPLP